MHIIFLHSFFFADDACADWFNHKIGAMKKQRTSFIIPGLDQKKFAELLGVSAWQLSQWKQGNRLLPVHAGEKNWPASYSRWIFPPSAAPGRNCPCTRYRRQAENMAGQ